MTKETKAEGGQEGQNAISGYCACCGAPNYIFDKGLIHTDECIWYEELDDRYPTMEHTKRTFWSATKSIFEMIWYVPQIVFWVVFDYIRLKKNNAG